MRHKAADAVPAKIKDMVRDHDNEMSAEVNINHQIEDLHSCCLVFKHTWTTWTLYVDLKSFVNQLLALLAIALCC